MVHVIIECHANNAFADHNTLLVHVKSNDTKEMKINFYISYLKEAFTIVLPCRNQI